MSDFDFSPAAIVPDAVRKYRIPLLGVELDVVGLNPAHEAFWSEEIGRMSAQAAIGGGEDTTPRDPDAILAHLRRRAPVVARHAIKGWSGVKRRGAVEPFSVEAATAFLLEMASSPTTSYLFRELLSFVTDPAHFTGAAVAASAKALAGNSSGG